MLNVWLPPLPEDGVTETAWGVWGTDTVQVPMVCQPEPSPSWEARIAKMFLVPAKAAWNVKARFRVAVFPADTVLDPAPLTMHWLFCKVAEVPSVIGPRMAVLLSLVSHTRACTGS